MQAAWLQELWEAGEGFNALERGKAGCHLQGYAVGRPIKSAFKVGTTNPLVLTFRATLQNGKAGTENARRCLR